MRKLAPFLLILVVSACTAAKIPESVREAGGDRVDQVYALLAIFNEVDDAALQFAQKPDTPQEVKNAIVRGRNAARSAIPILAEAAKTYRAAENQLSDDPDSIEKATVALQTLNDRFNAYAPAVQSFIDYIDSL